MTVLAILDFAGAAVFLLGGGVAAVFAARGVSGAEWLWALAAILLALGALRLLAGVGLWGLRGWGRILEIAVGILWLLHCPGGTIKGILALLFLFQPGVRALFTRPPSAWSEAETESLRRASGGMSVGFTIGVAVLLALVVPYMGIVSAIAIPNFLNAVERGKQKRTVADMRTLGAAIEACRADAGALPPARSPEDLRAHLVPTYLAVLPVRDGWNHPFRVATWDADGLPGEDSYAIVSPGKDGVLEVEEPWAYEGGPTVPFDADIVFRDGGFFRYPEGVVEGMATPVTTP